MILKGKEEDFGSGRRNGNESRFREDS